MFLTHNILDCFALRDTLSENRSMGLSIYFEVEEAITDYTWDREYYPLDEIRGLVV